MATRIRIKRGTESQITGYTGTHYEGELAYATNTGNVFVSDGTAFINIGGGGETPTLQSVTDEGNTTTNNIGIGTVVLRSSSYLNVKPTSNYGVLVRNSGDDNKYISMGVPGDYGFIKYKENLGSSVTINSTGVGIGTTAPSELLEVGNDSTSGNYIKIAKRDNSSAGIKISGSGGGREGFFRVNQGEDLEIGTEQTNDVTIFTNNVARINVNGDNEATQGYVGIGTTTPLYKLEVVGDARIDGGPFIIRGTNSFTTSSDTSGVLFNLGSGIRGFRFQNNNGELIRIDASGNVGIGTTAPVDKLHIKGGNIRIDSNTTAGQNLQFRNNGAPNALLSNTYNILGGSSSTTDFNTYVYGDNSYSIWTNNANRLSVNGAGNVGIGTTTPAAKLDVNGTTYLRSVALNTVFGYSGNNIQFINTGNTTFVGNVGVGTTAPSAKLDVRQSEDDLGLKIVGFDDEDNSNLHLFVDRFGNNKIISSEFLELNSGASSRYRAAGYLRLEVGGVSNQLQLDYNYIKLTSGGTETMRITPGKVGIGITSPAAKLHIATSTSGGEASAIIQDDVRTGTGTLNYIGLTDSAGTSQAKIGYLSTLNGDLSFSNLIGNTTVSSTGQVVLNASSNILLNTGGSTSVKIDNTGKVGIGTTSPESELTVNGYIQVPNGRGITFSDIGDGNANRVSIVGSEDSDTMFFKTDNSVRMAFASGNIGIGTTAPSDKLEVNTGGVNGKGIKIAYDSSNYVTFSKTTSTNFDIKSFIGGSEYGAIHFGNSVNIKTTNGSGGINFSRGLSTLMLINNGGNVGIGTTAPAAKLDVDGQVHLGPQSSTGFPSIDIASNGRTTIRGSAPALSVRDANNNGGYIDMNGGTLAAINSITSTGTLSVTSTNVRFGGDIGARVNIVGQDSSSQKVLGLKQGASGSNIMIDIRNSGNTSTMGLTSEGGFYFRDSDLVGRYTFDHDYVPSPADGLTTGFEFRTENASGVLTTFGYVDVTNDDKTLQESSMRLSVGQSTPAEIMRLQSDGNVGIGTTAPDSKLHVKATSGIAFKVDPNNADKEWYIDTTNPDHLKKEGNLILNADPTNVHTSTKISFNIDGSNKASINSDGDLGVGTTAQTSKVHVDGTAMRQLRMGTSGGPSSNTDTSGAIGDMAYDDNYFYIKTINGWGRVALDFGF